ncbi:hypothetical protein Pfo_007488 [Paulownia fortunei]|nr:hypothetical protein Pfo_007488 [Paulownia fortunei]
MPSLDVSFSCSFMIFSVCFKMYLLCFGKKFETTLEIWFHESFLLQFGLSPLILRVTAHPECESDRTPWINAGAGNECKDMGSFTWWRVHTSPFLITCNVSLFSISPPGYEKKGRPDDVNLIIKEKSKQKKHKDKKDKDKKERSERKEKERSEGKHKEDKDRKQKKHRDKKDKKKDERRSSEEKKIIGSLENQNGEKLGPDSKPSDGIQDYRVLVELGKRVRSDGGATDNQMVQKITLMEQRKANLPGKVQENSDGKLAEARVRNDGGATDNQMVRKITLMEQRKAMPGKVQENSDGKLAEAHNDITVKREHSRMGNGQSLKVDAIGLGNGLAGNFSRENQIKVEGGSCQVDKVEKRKKEKEKNEHRSVGEGDGRKNEDRNKNRKAEDKKRKKEKKKEKVKEKSKEKIKQRASDGNFLDFRDNNPSDLLKESRDSQGKLPKHKEPVFNGFLHDNGIRPNYMSSPAVSSHQVSQNGSDFHPSQNIMNLAVEKGAVIMNQKVNGELSSSQSVIKNVRNMEPCQTANNSTAEHGRASINNHVVSNGLISSHLVGIERETEPCQTTSNVAKVKQIINNHSTDDQFPSSHPLVENGRKMAGPNIDKVVDWQGADAVHKMDNKEFRMNRILEGKKYTSSRPSSASVKAKEKVGTSRKPPHPDLKHLSQILAVPKVEWPQFDDQEWLFGCKDSQAKRPKLASSHIEWTKQVWAEAIQVEYADVTAMPYVIPY